MNENAKPQRICEIEFRGNKVAVYHDTYQDDKTVLASWQARNPDSFYTGELFVNNETGEVTYPEDAVIPEQTPEDKERIPKFVIVGLDKLDPATESKIIARLEKMYDRYNTKPVPGEECAE